MNDQSPNPALASLRLIYALLSVALLLFPAGRSMAASLFEQPCRIELWVEDNATSKPLAGAQVQVSFSPYAVAQTVQAGPDGRALIDIPSGLFEWVDARGTPSLPSFDSFMRGLYIKVEVWAPGYVRTQRLWHRPGRDGAPTEPAYIRPLQTIRLDRRAPIGGRVVDPEGRPLEGVSITAQLTRNLHDFIPGLGVVVENVGKVSDSGIQSSAPEIVKTDAQGCWKYENLASPDLKGRPVAGYLDGMKELIKLEIAHADYHFLGIGPKRDASNIISDSAMVESLQRGEVEIVMDRIRGINLRLKNEDGVTIRNAQIKACNHNPEFMRQTWEERNKTYKLSCKGLDTAQLFITAKGCAPELVALTPSYPFLEKTITLKPGRRIHGVVTDQFGNPCKAFFNLAKWRGYEFLPPSSTNADITLTFETDANGRFEWREAPEGALPFRYVGLCPSELDQAKHAGPYLLTTMTQRAKPYAFKIPFPLNVWGKVIDAETSQTVPMAKLTAGVEQKPGRIEWDEAHPVPLKYDSAQGFHYLIKLTGLERKHYLRVEAPGYETLVSRPFHRESGTVRRDYTLKRSMGGDAKKSIGPAR